MSETFDLFSIKRFRCDPRKQLSLLTEQGESTILNETFPFSSSFLVKIGHAAFFAVKDKKALIFVDGLKLFSERLSTLTLFKVSSFWTVRTKRQKTKRPKLTYLGPEGTPSDLLSCGFETFSR